MILTVRVQSAIQYPVRENKFWFGGIAILFVYSNPSSIIPESNFLSLLVTYKRMPDESSIPVKSYSILG